MSAHPFPEFAAAEVPGLAYYTAAQPARPDLMAKPAPQRPTSRAAEALERMYGYYTAAD